MANPWLEFSDLFSAPVPLIGIVTQHVTGTDLSDVQLLGSGELIRVQGQSVAVGNRCFVANGAITGVAPAGAYTEYLV